MSWMTDIKQGNFLIYKDSFICIITNISKQDFKDDSNIIFEGIDVQNNTFCGKADNWKPITYKMNDLQCFKEVLSDNIVCYKNKKSIK